jgi:predicted DNA-binding protein with PD1-like motif
MKSTEIGEGREKAFVLVFATGEEVVSGLLRFAAERGLTGAHFTAIGAFERVTLGFFDLAKKDYKRIAVDEQVELLSLVGNIARGDDGDPKLHAHAVVGKSDGTTRGGHLLEAYVRPTLEVMVTASSQSLHRRMHPDLGLALLDLPSS